MPKKENLTGTLFAIPLPSGEFLFGKVTLDIGEAKRKRLLPANSPILGFSFGLLVEVYREVQPTMDFALSPRLVAGTFINRGDWEKWPRVGHAPINPKEVAFPEALVAHSHDRGEISFRCGEIQLGLNFTRDVLFDQIKVFMSMHPRSSVMLSCLKLVGREAEIREHEQYEAHALCRSDLRWSVHREIVYQHLPIDMNATYYEQQQSLGLDLDRLYA